MFVLSTNYLFGQHFLSHGQFFEAPSYNESRGFCESNQYEPNVSVLHNGWVGYNKKACIRNMMDCSGHTVWESMGMDRPKRTIRVR